jgi:regulator of RNase E activity RraA
LTLAGAAVMMGVWQPGCAPLGERPVRAERRIAVTVLEPAVLAALRAIDSATIANAIEAFDVRDRTEGYLSRRVRCLFPEMGVLAGYAVTATIDTTTPGGPKPPGARWALYEALAAAPKPAVVVLKAVGPNLEHSCVCGGVMASIMRRLGAVGLVTDGGVRDLADMRGLGFRCFAPGIVVAHGTIGILEAGIPVEMDGVTIRPGDLLHGDENGIVLVPPVDGAALLAEAETLLARERSMMAYAGGDDFSLDGLRRLMGI